MPLQLTATVIAASAVQGTKDKLRIEAFDLAGNSRYILWEFHNVGMALVGFPKVGGQDGNDDDSGSLEYKVERDL